MEKENESKNLECFFTLKKGKDGAIEGANLDYYGQLHLPKDRVCLTDYSYEMSAEDTAILYSMFNRDSVAMVKDFYYMGMKMADKDVYIYCSEEAAEKAVKTEVSSVFKERDFLISLLDRIPGFIKRLFIKKEDMKKLEQL